MPFIPSILNYKPFYIQCSGDTTAWDTADAYGMVAKVNPLPLLPNPKETYNNDWKDEDGDDEYVANIYYEAFEFSVTFYIKAYATESSSAEAVLRDQVSSFFEKVRSGEFKTYDSYTGVGYQKVRYYGYEEESFKRREDWARAIFTITFKVNDPVTRMIYDNGTIGEL